MIFALLFLCLGVGAVSTGGSTGGARSRPPCLEKLNITRLKKCLWQGRALNKTRPPICKDFAQFKCLNFSRTKMSAMNTLWCPNCISPQLLVANCREKVMTCAAGVKPRPVMKDTPYGISFCPSCRPLDAPAKTCTPAQVKACYARMTGPNGNRPIACKEGERPLKDGCCVSCLPPTVNCFPNSDPRTYRNSTQVKTCITQQKTVPVCANGTRPPIKSCCRSCRPMGTPDMDRPVVSGQKQKCSRANFQKALDNAPECELNEKPLKNKDQVSCAPSCRRPSSSFKLTEVISCLAGLAECAAGSRPEFIPGDRCPTCKPKKPVCVGCNATQVCIKKQVNGKWMPKCVRKGFLKMRVTLKEANFRTKVKALTKPETVQIIKEMVARYCERPGAIDLCDRFKDRIDESLDVSEKTDVAGTTDKVDIKITISFDRTPPNANGGRRLLQSPDPTVLLKDAVADTDPTLMGIDSSTNGVDTGTNPNTPTSGSPGTNTKSSGSKLVSGLITVVSMVAYLIAL